MQQFFLQFIGMIQHLPGQACYKKGYNFFFASDSISDHCAGQRFAKTIADHNKFIANTRKIWTGSLDGKSPVHCTVDKNVPQLFTHNDPGGKRCKDFGTTFALKKK